MNRVLHPGIWTEFYTQGYGRSSKPLISLLWLVVSCLCSLRGNGLSSWLWAMSIFTSRCLTVEPISSSTGRVSVASLSPLGSRRSLARSHPAPGCRAVTSHSSSSPAAASRQRAAVCVNLNHPGEPAGALSQTWSPARPATSDWHLLCVVQTNWNLKDYMISTRKCLRKGGGG